MLAGAAAGAGAPGLRRGISLTNWFRYPPSRDPARIARYLSEAAMTGMRGAGFDFVRLAVQPEFACGLYRDVLLDAVRRLQRHGFTTIVGPHPVSWRLETSAADRDALADFWLALAPGLHGLDASRTVAEVLNEPVFSGDAAAWAALQLQVVRIIRARLPGRRVLLTGNEWGGVDGLLSLRPIDDPDLLYGFHFYEPAELTSLAAYRAGLDRAALARLLFPMTPAGCIAAEAGTDAATRGLIRFVCAMGWDTARVTARIGAAAAWGARHGVTVLLGEFGCAAALNAPARLAWLAAVRRACEAQGIGWALWGYDDAMGLGVRPEEAAPPMLDAAVLGALGML